MWHVWDRGRAYFVTSSTSVKIINIEANPSVVLAHPDTEEALILHGWAPAADWARGRLRPLFQNKYDWDIEDNAAYDRVIEITPTQLIAWDDGGQQRWSGAEVRIIWKV